MPLQDQVKREEREHEITSQIQNPQGLRGRLEEAAHATKRSRGDRQVSSVLIHKTLNRILR